MRKSVVVALVFAVVLVTSPISSFADEPLFFYNQGPIAGLQFIFGDSGVRVDLSSIGINAFYALSVNINTAGQESAIINPNTKDYYYYGSYDSGTIYAYTTEGDVIPITMVSATLAEQFVIHGSLKKAIKSPFTVQAPADTSLIFNAVLSGIGTTVRFALIVRDGEIIFAGTY